MTAKMTAKETVARLRERVAALVAARTPVLDVVVLRNPGETEAEAIVPICASIPR
jgi:hypothetical protein